MQFFSQRVTNLDAELYVLPSVHVHPGIEKPNFSEELSVHNERAADHRRRPGQKENQQKCAIIDIFQCLMD